jgi:hypothetical protein
MLTSVLAGGLAVAALLLAAGIGQVAGFYPIFNSPKKLSL